MKLIITGATGFIGRHLVGRLSTRHEIVTLVREGTMAPQWGESVPLIESDLTRPLQIKSLPSRIDAVIHLAQANVSFPEAANELLAVNTTATLQLLEYARQADARQFIFASSGDVYGQRHGPAKESDLPLPIGFYAATKYAAELLANAYSSYLNLCIMRLYHPYGPGQSNRLIPKLADRIRQRRPVSLHQDDRPRMTPIYIDDVGCAIERAMESSSRGTINIAGNGIVSMRELAEHIGRVCAIEPQFEATGKNSGDLIGDNHLMKKTLGDWEMVSLVDGLSRTFKTEETVACRVNP